MTFRRGRGQRPGEESLRDDLAVAFEAVTKTYSAAHDARYRPAVSIFARWQERRSEIGGSPSEGLDVVDEDGEDEEEDEEFLRSGDQGAAITGLSFDVRRGEAVAIAGSASESATVARVLCRMVAPTSGRILVRGRVAPSVEFATLLVGRETTVRGVARRLSTLVGPPRGLRRQFVDAALDLALGDAPGLVAVARPSRDVLHRVAASAAFDPTADVLVVDALATLGDPDFARRCRTRLVERLAAGAAAVVTAREWELLGDLCTRVVVIEDGRVARILTREEMRRGAMQVDRAVSDADPPASAWGKPPLRTFSAHGALLSFGLFRSDGSPLRLAGADDELMARIAFELTSPATVKLLVRVGERATERFAERYTLDAGAHVATLRLPPGTVPAGSYSASVGLVIDCDGERARIGRRDAARLEIEADDGDLTAVTEAGVLSATPSGRRASAPEWSVGPPA